MSQLENPENSTVLDAGAGTGNHTFEMCKFVKKIVAFEIDEGMLSQINNKIRRENIENVELVKGSITDMDDLS